jgi:hypothetical protein
VAGISGMGTKGIVGEIHEKRKRARNLEKEASEFL